MQVFNRLTRVHFQMIDPFQHYFAIAICCDIRTYVQCISVRPVWHAGAGSLYQVRRPPPLVSMAVVWKCDYSQV